MSDRLAMIAAAETPGVSVTALCAAARISRKTFYELRKRVLKEGVAGLEPRSRRPHSSPGQIPAWLEQRICRLREQLPVDHGAEAIFFKFAPATIHKKKICDGIVRHE